MAPARCTRACPAYLCGPCACLSKRRTCRTYAWRSTKLWPCRGSSSRRASMQAAALGRPFHPSMWQPAPRCCSRSTLARGHQLLLPLARPSYGGVRCGLARDIQYTPPAAPLVCPFHPSMWQPAPLCCSRSTLARGHQLLLPLARPSYGGVRCGRARDIQCTSPAAPLMCLLVCPVPPVWLHRRRPLHCPTWCHSDCWSHTRGRFVF